MAGPTLGLEMDMPLAGLVKLSFSAKVSISKAGFSEVDGHLQYQRFRRF
jgi:hypothetical protein